MFYDGKKCPHHNRLIISLIILELLHQEVINILFAYSPHSPLLFLSLAAALCESELAIVVTCTDGLPYCA